MSGSKPIVIIVPALWYANSGAWTTVTRGLQRKGYSTITANLSANGCTAEQCPDLDDDIMVVRAFIEPVVRKGAEVIMVLHSAGGFIGGAAIEGLTRKERKAQGKKGGVVAISFICGCLLSENAVWNFLEVKGNACECKNPRLLMFNDLDDDDAQPWLDQMEPFPSPLLYQTNPDLPHEGFLDTRCFYLITEKDLIFPVPLQEMFAESANAEVVRIDTGHMPMISQPDKVVEYIDGCAMRAQKQQ